MECESKDEDLIPWFKEDPLELAGFIYCFDILKQYEVINPFIQLNLIHPAVSTAVPMYLELLEKKTLNNSGCLNFDFDALRSLPQGSSLREYF